jgi:hypothetical protein
VLAAALGLVAGFAVPGCGEEEVAPPSLADVLFEGSASDEAWLAIAEAAVSDDPAGASWVFTPSTFTRSGTPPTFTWTDAAPGVHGPRRGPARLPPRQERPTERFARGLAELLHPVAHAHLPPVTGTVYRLIFSVPGQSAPLRVLTTDRSFTPGGAAFTKLASATGPISLELVHTYLMENRVMEGPYRLPILTITPE